MSTYSYDTSTIVGKIRLLISDTDIDPIADAQFSDEELTAFYTMATNMFGGQAAIYEGASISMRSWARSSVGDINMEKIGDYQYQKGSGREGASTVMAARAADLHQLALDTPATDWAEFDFEYYADSDDIVRIDI